MRLVILSDTHGHIHEAAGTMLKDGWLTVNAAQRISVVDL